jgi:hypothetical protein
VVTKLFLVILVEGPETFGCKIRVKPVMDESIGV